MSVHLVYHRPSDVVSAFDKRVIAIARDAEISIACPYLTLTYLRRLIELSRAWRLITDVDEWLGSISKSQRNAVVTFIENHDDLIRHSSDMHAKLLIGSKAAILGSANFTTSGIQNKTELGVYVTDKRLKIQLKKWFDNLWKNSYPIPTLPLRELVAGLPDPPDRPRQFKIVGQLKRRQAPLVDVDELLRLTNGQGGSATDAHVSQPDLNKVLFVYKNARGCYVNNVFHVLAGSTAAGRVSRTFETISSGRYYRKRNRLIAEGVLVQRDGEWQYSFTVDIPFNSKSEAAYIIDGNSRSGSVWKRI
jgi:PLD-like domain